MCVGGVIDCLWCCVCGVTFVCLVVWCVGFVVCVVLGVGCDVWGAVCGVLCVVSGVVCGVWCVVCGVSCEVSGET